MNMKKIVNDYIDELEDKAKHSDKYFVERNELFIEKEQIKKIIRKWRNNKNVVPRDLLDYLEEIDNIVFKPEIIRGE